jgi:undecaprenyl diphosphate synthase
MHDPTSSSARAASSGSPNYLLWQSAYSELHFTDVLWPDFSRADFEAALESYEARKRRFGGR